MPSGLVAQGWSAARVATALERDAHTIGGRAAEIEAQGPAGLSFEQRRWRPLNFRPIALPGYSPDFIPDDAIWDRIRG